MRGERKLCMKVSGKNKSSAIKNSNDLRRIQAYLKINNKKAYILFSIGLATGYRGSDLVNLTIQDLREAIRKESLDILEQKTINTRKVSFKRKAPLGNKLKSILKEFVEGKEDSEYVYSSRKGSGEGKYKQHIRRDSLGKEFKKAAIKCGINNITVGTHTPRKTYGYIQYLEHDKDINYVQELFGHASIRATKSYIGIDDDVLNESSMIIDKYL